jgi:hypothetical protein
MMAAPKSWVLYPLLGTCLKGGHSTCAPSTHFWKLATSHNLYQGYIIIALEFKRFLLTFTLCRGLAKSPFGGGQGNGPYRGMGILATLGTPTTYKAFAAYFLLMTHCMNQPPCDFDGGKFVKRPPPPKPTEPTPGLTRNWGTLQSLCTPGASANSLLMSFTFILQGGRAESGSARKGREWWP